MTNIITAIMLNIISIPKIMFFVSKITFVGGINARARGRSVSQSASARVVCCWLSLTTTILINHNVKCREVHNFGEFGHDTEIVVRNMGLAVISVYVDFLLVFPFFFLK